ncbi:MAG TPA: glycoside hydrolase family 6 protein [Vicinamibacterales bacterium]|nr:glycoside hydrolase family 6 protein [Vicinamibacterales bacterium]
MSGRDAVPRVSTRPSSNLRIAPLVLIPFLLLSDGEPNPFKGQKLYVDPNSAAKRQAETWKRSRPVDSELIGQIAEKPVARWIGGWGGDIRREVNQAVSTMTGSGALPVFVAYNIPYRDCGSYSAGGSATAAAYRKWIKDFASGIGGRNAIVILEPDALAGMDCLPPAGRQERVTLISEAVQTLRAQRASVYLDAGHANWHAPAEMAKRLQQAGIDRATGFSLNVSNFSPTQSNVAYGEKLSRLVGGKHFIIDTSRNGVATNSKEWCNPAGRALGVAPTTDTGHPLVDAFLWVKAPGESDGTCGGGPRAGSWWSNYALELSRMAAALSGRER